MKYTTYASGLIDISDLPMINKIQIKSYLEEFYGKQEASNFYDESNVIIYDEWESFEEGQEFLFMIYKISKQIRKDVKSLIICNGERDGDIWGVIIKDNRMFTQRFELKPDGNMEEYDKVGKK